MVAALALKKDNSSIPLERLCNFADRADSIDAGRGRGIELTKPSVIKGLPISEL
jgi:hypothetical protein